MHKDLWKLIPVCLCLVLLVFLGYNARNTMAYLSAKGPTKINRFTIGHVSVDIVEDFRPPSSLVVGTNSYVKKVQFKNSGTVPAYIRASLLFSNGDVENISMVSADNGAHWYRLSELKDHLPSGWAYRSDGVLGGYYYYTNPVNAGELTPALITNVKTDFINKTADTNETINKTPRDYDIFVYTEGVQQMKLDGSESNTDYAAAWTAFLNLK